MTAKLVETVTGMGSDGCRYTIHGYAVDGEKLVSFTETSDGEQAICRSENPLTFEITGSGVIVDCSKAGGNDV